MLQAGAVVSRLACQCHWRVREGVRVALADCEAIFRAQEPNKRMRDHAARVCRALCRARVAEELLRRKGTRIAEHLTLVLKIIDRRAH